MKTAIFARKKIDILGLAVDDVTLDEAIGRICETARAHRADPNLPPLMVATANPEYVMATRSDNAFRALINNSAGLVTPDGVGLMYAARLLGRPLRQRVTGVALTQELARYSAQNGGFPSLFLLGAGPGIAEEAASKLRALYPGVGIAGLYEGQAGPDGDAESLVRIQAAEPDIVLVAYGMVKQDQWAARNLIKSGAAVSIGVGGVFDYLSGRVPLAPLWMRRAGLEWLYRLYQQPWRWRRMLALPRFVLLVLLTALQQRFPTQRRRDAE